MAKIQQLNETLNDLKTKAEAVLSEEEVKKVYEEHKIPEEEEVEAIQETNERG